MYWTGEEQGAEQKRWLEISGLTVCGDEGVERDKMEAGTLQADVNKQISHSGAARTNQ